MCSTACSAICSWQVAISWMRSLIASMTSCFSFRLLEPLSAATDSHSLITRRSRYSNSTLYNKSTILPRHSKTLFSVLMSRLQKQKIYRIPPVKQLSTPTLCPISSQRFYFIFIMISKDNFKFAGSNWLSHTATQVTLILVKYSSKNCTIISLITSLISASALLLSFFGDSSSTFILITKNINISLRITPIPKSL